MAKLKIEITRNLVEVMEIIGTIHIGRGEDNEIVIPHGIISRHHCKIYRDGCDFVLEDINSCSGLYVNGWRCSYKVLQDKDCIKFGIVNIYFSTEVWNSPDEVIDFTKNAISEYNREELITRNSVIYKFYSDDETINQIYEIAREKFELLDINDMEKINLDAALNEAIGNAQKHGHEYKFSLVIDFCYILTPEKLTMRITDQGKGFDYRDELRRKRTKEWVEDAKARYKTGEYGGLGIMLMLKCVHQVEYNSKGNQITLVRFLDEAARKFEEDQRLRIREEDDNRK